MSPQRILLVAPPFAGHLHPLLGLGRALADAGHAVAVASTSGAAPAIRAAGLAAHALLEGADATLKALVDPPYRIGSNPWRLHRQLKLNLSLLADFRAELAALVARWRPSLLLADFTLPVAGAVARAAGVRWWTTHPSPCVIETRAGPPAYLGGWRPREGWHWHLRDALGRALVRAGKRAAAWWYRRELAALGLGALYRADGSEVLYSDQCLLALGVEAFEFGRGWPPATRFLGPVLYTPPSALPPPDDDALPASRLRPRVLVTLGTHLAWRKPPLIEELCAVAQALPRVDLVLSLGDRAAAAPRTWRLPSNLRVRAWVPYDRELSGYALVLHHGGAGVLWYTLAAGLPALVWPQDYDQFDHAARLLAAGLAMRIRDAGDLVAAIPAALADGALQMRVRSFRAQWLSGADAAARLCALVAALPPPAAGYSAVLNPGTLTTPP